MVIGQNDVVQQFVENGLWGDERRFGKCSTIGFAINNNLISGIVYHNYQPWHGTIEISAYSKSRHWANKSAINYIFNEYPFNQLNCRALLARHSEHNKIARSIWTRLGAEEYLIPGLISDIEGEVVAVLRRKKFQTSKFMRENYGQALSA